MHWYFWHLWLDSRMSTCPVSKQTAADDTGVLTASLVRPFRAFSHFKSILDKEVTPDADVKCSPYTDGEDETVEIDCWSRLVGDSS